LWERIGACGFKIKIKIIKDEQKYINKNKRSCSAKFGFIQKAALNGLQGCRFPTPGLYNATFLEKSIRFELHVR
jgi:hypothetical protein